VNIFVESWKSEKNVSMENVSEVKVSENVEKEEK
jgi:hypothetical protein